MSTICCANFPAHENKTKIGQKPSFPKGHRRLNHSLSTFLTNTSSISFTEDDYLCTSCYQRSMEKFNDVYISMNSPPMEIDRSRPTRAAAAVALSNISTLNYFDMFQSDQDKSPDISDDEIMQQAFLLVEEFFRFAYNANDHQVMKGDLEPNRPIESFFIKSADIDSIFKKILERRWACLETRSRWIEGIQSKHQFDPVGIGEMKCRRTSTDRYSETFQLF